MDIDNEKTYYNDEGEYGKYIMSRLDLPARLSDPKAQENYERYAKRILWMDNDNVPGSFQVNASWYLKPNLFIIDEAIKTGVAFFDPHTHDVDEVAAFFGTDPEHPEELNGEIVFYMGGEKHVVTRSSLIFIPAGVPHGPMYIQKADKPIFHFSCVMKKTYDWDETKEEK